MSGATEYLIKLNAQMTGGDAAVTQLTSLAKNLTSAGTAAVKLDKTLEHTKGIQSASVEAARGSTNFGKLSGALGQLGGPLGQVGGKAVGAADALRDIAEVLGRGTGAAIGGVVALTAVVAAFVVGVGVAIVKTAQWAIGLADAGRSAGLATEALEQTSDSLRGLGDLIPGIQRSTTLSADSIRKLAGQLADAKVKAKDMPAALRAIALAEDALQGQGGAAKFIADLKAGRTTVGALSKDIEQKFGGIVAKKLLSLDAQAATLKRNFGVIFGDLKIEPLLEGLQTLVALFDASTTSGQTIKFLFETIFQPLVDAVVKAIPVIEAFFLGLLIGALRTYIALKPAIRALQEFFGFESDASLETSLAKVTELGALVFSVFAAGAALIAAPFVLGAAQVKLFGDAIVAAINFGMGAVQGAVAWLRSVSLADIGAQMIQGLADGIRNAGGRVLEAITGVVRGAIGAAKNLLQLHSPSKVFEEMGGLTAQGFAGGVEDGTGGAQSALESLVAPPRASAAGGAGGGNTINISAINITAPNGDARSIANEVRDVLRDIMDGELIRLGAWDPGEAT